MKVKPLHIVFVLALSGLLFGVGLWLYPHILDAVLIHKDGLKYIDTDMGGPAQRVLRFGAAFALLPLFTYAGWIITKLQTAKQRQTFVGVQLIIFFVAGVYWYLSYRQQVNSIADFKMEGVQIQNAIPVDKMMMGEFMIAGAIIGFLVALGLSAIIKKIK